MIVSVCNANDGRTESLPVEGSTLVNDLLSLAAPLLGADASTSGLMLNSRFIDNAVTLEVAGVHDGDLLIVATRMTSSLPGGNLGTAPQPLAQPLPATSAPASSGAPSQLPMNLLGGLSGGGGGLNLIPAMARMQSSAVEWDGMSLDEALENNSNPAHLVQIVRSHPNVLKELNYHDPKLAAMIRDAPFEEAVQGMRNNILKNSSNNFMGKFESRREEAEMEKRLHLNPYDKEANDYFGKKIEQQNINNQYQEMMNQYPEAMARVLMLYVDCEVNGRPIVAFVDSGAQSTIMSSACAERLDILRLVDTRFAGVAVGVGSGKILGRIHLVNLKMGGYFFPCTITVMDSKEGLGDKNMDFLFGLDMLKRHRCKIDLAQNALVLTVDDKDVATPFLAEYQLDESKGGTRGFNPEQANAEIDGRNQAASEDAPMEVEVSSPDRTCPPQEEEKASQPPPDASTTGHTASTGQAPESAPPDSTSSSSSSLPSIASSSIPATSAQAPPQTQAQQRPAGGLLDFTLDFTNLNPPQDR